jgi:hypothetical protein
VLRSRRCFMALFKCLWVMFQLMDPSLTFHGIMENFEF